MKINKTARLLIYLLKSIGLRGNKEHISYRNSIRPMSTRTTYPKGWSEPKIYTCEDGTEILYGFTTFFKRDERSSRIPVSDAIDNSH